MVGVSMTWETVLKGPSIRKVERHHPKKDGIVGMVVLEAVGCKENPLIYFFLFSDVTCVSLVRVRACACMHCGAWVHMCVQGCARG